MEEQSKIFIRPSVDYSFKKIFGDERNESILIDFLCAILNLKKEEIKILEIKNSEVIKGNISDPSSRLDILVQINKTEMIDIEIQLQIHKALPERMVKYWAQNFVTTLKIAIKNTQLKPCISIWILDECLYKEIDKTHMVFEILEKNEQIKLSDLLQIHVIELPKVDNDDYTSLEDNKLLEWLRFLKLKSDEEVEKMRNEVVNIEVGKAIDILKIFSLDEKNRMEYFNRISALGDYNTDIDEARREGKVEGKIEGKEEAARNLLDVLDVETIAEKIGLTVERVLELKKEQ